MFVPHFNVHIQTSNLQGCRSQYGYSGFGHSRFWPQIHSVCFVLLTYPRKIYYVSSTTTCTGRLLYQVSSAYLHAAEAMRGREFKHNYQPPLHKPAHLWKTDYIILYIVSLNCCWLSVVISQEYFYTPTTYTLFFILRSAHAAISASTADVCPWLQALCRGVSPLCTRKDIVHHTYNIGKCCLCASKMGHTKYTQVTTPLYLCHGSTIL